MTDQQEVTMFKASSKFSVAQPVIDSASQTFLTEAGKQELLTIWQDMLSTLTPIAQCPSPKAYQAMVSKFAREGLDYETIWSQVSEKGQTFQ
jgi:hypothetical protein